VVFKLPCDFALEAAPCDESFRLDGLIARPSHDEYVSVARVEGTYVDPIGVGSLSILNSSDIALNALRPILDLDAAARAGTSVRLSLVKHVRVSGEWNARRFVGLDTDWGPHDFYFPGGEAPAVRPAPPPPLPPITCDSDDDFAVLACPPRAPPKAKPKLKPKRAPNAAAIPALTYGTDVCSDCSFSSGDSAGSGLEPDNDTESDVCSESAGPDMSIPLMELVPAPAMPTIDSTQMDVNVCEIDHELYARNADGSVGRHLGRIEFIHGQRFSIKCVCAFHGSCASASTATNDGEAHPLRCQLLMMCEARCIDKYRASLLWLLEAKDLCKADHLRRCAAVRTSFGIAVGKKQPK
jgi:hypothetical protein